MENKLVAGIVAAAIAIIVLAGVLMPTLSNATKTEDTLSNVPDSMYSVEKITPDSTYKLVWDTTTPDYVTINDTDQVAIVPGTIICSLDSFLIRCSLESGKKMMQSVGESLGVYVSVNFAPGTLTLENNSGTLTVTSYNSSTTTTTTKTVTFDTMYGVYKDGHYVMKSSGQSAYMLADSDIVAMGLTTLDGQWQNIIQILGDVEGVTISQVYPTTPTHTFSNESINYTMDSSHVGVYLLDDITFTATNINTSTETACTYSYFIVPSEITAEKAQHLTDAQIVILDVIPLLIIVAVLLGVVAVFILRRE